MGQIFLSHVEEDVSLVRKLAVSLESCGYSVWYYERDSHPGRDYVDQIITAIEKSAAVVVVVSGYTFRSENVDREITRAYDRGRPLIPLLKDLSYDEIGKRRDAWAFRFGPATAVSVSGDLVEDALGPLVLGLVELGIEKDPDRRQQSMAPMGQRTEAGAAGASASQAPTGGLPLPAEILQEESKHASAASSARNLSDTTLRVSTGERVETADAANRTDLGGRRRRSWAVAAVLAVLVAGGASAGVGWRKLHLSDARSVSAPVNREPLAPAAPTPPPVAPPSPAAPSQPAHVEKTIAPAVSQPKPKPPGRSPSHHKPTIAAKSDHPLTSDKAGPAPGHDGAPAAQPSKTAAQKPNCATTFTLDAQGYKHFKHECFP